MKIYSVHDAAVGLYLEPFFMRSDGEALRAFMAAVNDRNHQFHKHASDFRLLYLGEFDESSGWLAQEDVECIGKAWELLVPTEQSAVNGGGVRNVEVGPMSEEYA